MICTASPPILSESFSFSVFNSDSYLNVEKRWIYKQSNGYDSYHQPIDSFSISSKYFFHRNYEWVQTMKSCRMISLISVEFAHCFKFIIDYLFGHSAVHSWTVCINESSKTTIVFKSSKRKCPIHCLAQEIYVILSENQSSEKNSFVMNHKCARNGSLVLILCWIDSLIRTVVDLHVTDTILFWLGVCCLVVFVIS